jgi:hypothetical protein
MEWKKDQTMPDSNLKNQSGVNSNTRVEWLPYTNGGEKYLGWFSIYLEYQAQNSAFFEYIVKENEDGRQ